MDFRQIQYFIALFEEESITKAARRLHVVQPAVSMQIRRLETDYGVHLFDRTGQGVTPNSIAKRLYPLCKEVMAKIGAVRACLSEASGRMVGKISVGVPPSVAQAMIADILVEFHQLNPEVQVVVHEGYSANLVQWLVQGDLDFAIVTSLEGERRLRYQPLVTEELQLVTSAETPLPSTTIRGSDLDQFNLVLPSSQNLLRILVENEFKQSGLDLRLAMEIDSLVTVFRMVRKPGWASIVPASALMNLEGTGLRRLRLVEPVIHRQLVVAFPAQREPSPAAQLLIGRLEAVLSDLDQLQINKVPPAF